MDILERDDQLQWQTIVHMPVGRFALPPVVYSHLVWPVACSRLASKCLYFYVQPLSRDTACAIGAGHETTMKQSHDEVAVSHASIFQQLRCRHRLVSPAPMGCTPGHLSRACNQATSCEGCKSCWIDTGGAEPSSNHCKTVAQIAITGSVLKGCTQTFPHSH